MTKNLSYTETQNEGWNLIGNPFSSTIDWDLLTKTASVNAAVYIIQASDGAYISWNGSVGDISNGYISPHQGFFVKVDAIGQNITMTAEDQLHASSVYFYKDEVEYSETLKISLEGESSVSNTYFQFRNDASSDFDINTDAYKLFGFASVAQLYSELDGIKYSINCLNHSTETVSVPLGINLQDDEDLSLNFSGLQTFYSSIRIDLEDLQTAQTINIRENPTYSFSANSTDEPNRFLLHFNGVTNTQDIENTQDIFVYSLGSDIYINSSKILTAEVFIYNISGQLIKEEKMDGVSFKKIDIKTSTGIYLISIKTADEVYTKKIMLK